MTGPAHLACRWSATATGAAVLPDGCADIVWDGARLVVAGPATVPVRGAAAPGAAVLGVRFRVGAARAALGVPAADLRDETVELADVWGPAGARLAERIGSAAPEERLALLDAAVAARVRELPEPDPAVRAAVAAVVAAGGGRPAAVDAVAGAAGRGGPATWEAAVAGAAGRGRTATWEAAVAGPAGRGGPATWEAAVAGAAVRGRTVAAAAVAASGLSERALRRRFAAAVGYGPALLARVLRLQRFLRLAAGRAETSLGRLAADAGYADHAHLVHDCRALAGATPGELVARGARPAGEPLLDAPPRGPTAAGEHVVDGGRAAA